MTRTHKKIILMIVDTISIYISSILAYFFLSQYLSIPTSYVLGLQTIVVLVYLLVALRFHIFSTISRYTDYRTLAKIAVISVISYGLLFLANLLNVVELSYRFIVLSCLLTILLNISSRLSWRALLGYIKQTTQKNSKREQVPTLMIGAGEGGDLFLKTILSAPSELNIVAIVDKDRNKVGTFLHGVRVVGTDVDIVPVIQNYEIKQVVIAIPSLTSSDYERILRQCQKAGVKVTSMPKYEDVITGKLEVAKLREIDITDLLGREEVKLDQSSLESNLSGKTILVTGAGGSIGSEICRQVSRFHPARLLLLGHGENSIYLIHRELKNRYGNDFEIVPIIADIQDRDLIFQIMRAYRPDRVYHAAAHKHVPLMEYNPREAVKNNIFGTKNVAEVAKAAGVGKFVMISTDKAVNPPNVMGATKRVAEMIVTGLNEAGSTKFAAVRFGNVLGSRGSVVPVFKDQIAKGGPVTVTDFRMTRYFMTIPEASRLVIQAGAMMKGGEIFVLDMGEPVKILDLAKKMILLSGYREEEIQIVQSGIRPGEKLYEELLSTEERVSEQIYDKIFVGRVTNQKAEVVQHFIDGLLAKNVEQLKLALIDFAKQE